MAAIKCKQCGNSTYRDDRGEVTLLPDLCGSCLNVVEIKGDKSAPPEWAEGRLANYYGQPRVTNPYWDGSRESELASPCMLWWDGWDYQEKNG